MTRSIKRSTIAALVLLTSLAVMVATSGIDPAGAAVGSTHNVGMVCTSKGANPTFTLVTKTGYISLPDGATAFMWGYALSGQPFQHPSPVLCVNEGDVVTIVLKNNNLPEATSLIFPGQTNVLADGAPSQPVFSGGALTSLTQTAAVGGSVTYQFTADHPGTFLYQSGTDPAKQTQMGLFGALVVRPLMGTNFAYNDASTQFNQGAEFLILLSEIDPTLHARAEAGKAFNMNNYHPRYWMINGRGFPDSIADNGASWLPNQPYGSMSEILPYDATHNPLPSLDRFISVGTDDYPFHPHGNNAVVVGRDGNLVTAPFDKFSVPVGPGQTWDALFTWQDDNQYSPQNPVDVIVPNLANLEVGPFYSGTPYLGVQGTLPPGFSSQNECGEYYILAHNHSLYQITSPGAVVMTGPITYTRVDPVDADFQPVCP
jgi:FtsP/CotA-like multicopper oxidase with cupredoxin domain